MLAGAETPDEEHVVDVLIDKVTRIKVEAEPWVAVDGRQRSLGAGHVKGDL
jgi:hypothetical protein